MKTIIIESPPLVVGTYWEVLIVIFSESFVIYGLNVQVEWPIAIILSILAVVLMEMAGIFRHETWLARIPGQLDFLASQRDIFSISIEQLKNAAARKDGRIDQAISGLKGIANIPLGIGPIVWLASADMP